ncbi:NADH-ubiquinone oxidoreductase subunit NDUFA12 family protein [Candidatus Anaplasma sp. TIGMIC]|uniref:NADH-ubiquinone oxidoreductase subunit NDUFA12 family protein n=1 Tax=Candidatus Anaplasma sp. TIGMIC TaxID=3020713 RepID=UPI0023301532|nr:NADH-ubiquinone oxidoreductase subunit NDUFA12 family protein [Candidatus Anaplasma sp. TIGMIC]MDB1135337.1 NADH-ubiquinone oxidoreductase subunit NDUFA12 family protein [Candidatus Anaplasma sp. TIGMIC]
MGVRAFFFQKLKFFIRNRARCVYTDNFGNSYYSRVVRGKEQRWVTYGGRADPSTVPARCHLWLHYTCDEILPECGGSVHVPNMTGTDNAYHPHKATPPNAS